MKSLILEDIENLIYQNNLYVYHSMEYYKSKSDIQIYYLKNDVSKENMNKLFDIIKNENINLDNIVITDILGIYNSKDDSITIIRILFNSNKPEYQNYDISIDLNGKVELIPYIDEFYNHYRINNYIIKRFKI